MGAGATIVEELGVKREGKADPCDVKPMEGTGVGVVDMLDPSSMNERAGFGT